MMSINDDLQSLLSDEKVMNELVIDFIKLTTNAYIQQLNDYLNNMKLLPGIINGIDIKDMKNFYEDDETECMEFDLISFLYNYLEEENIIKDPREIIKFLLELNNSDYEYFDNVEDYYFSFTRGVIGFTHNKNTYILFEYYGQGKYIYRLLNFGNTTLNYKKLVLPTKSDIQDEINNLEQVLNNLLQNQQEI